MTLTAGLDFGTSSVKLAIAHADGTVVARAQAGYETSHGVRGEAEQRPEDWWDAARAALRETGIAGRVDALGLTGQMQNLIPVAGSRAVRPTLLYSDTRATREHARLRAQLPGWESDTGNQQDASNVAAKIAWLAEHDPAALAEAEHLLLGAPGYIAWRATGRAACDVLTASSTGLLGVAERGWLTDVVRAAGASPEQLPQLVGQIAGDELVGSINAAAATDLGVRAGIPIVHTLGDAGATTDGLVGSDPGDAYVSLGTTGWLAAVTNAPSTGLAVTPMHSLVMPGWGSRLRISAVQSAGSTADWARRTFFPGLDFAAVEERVATRVSAADAITVRPLCLPGLAGERAPVRDAKLRGAFVGVHEGTGPEDFYLASLTGVAMALRHAADELSLTQTRIPLVGGAAQSHVWRQILADVLEATIVTRSTDDPGTHSAVRATARVLGLEPPRPLFAPSPSDIETRPSAARTAYDPLLATHRALYGALTPSFHALAREA